MARESLHRSSSGGAIPSSSSVTSVKMWRLSSAFKRHPRRHSAKDEKNGVPRSSPSDLDPHDRTQDPALIGETYESNCRKLHAIVQRVRSAHSSPSHVDAAYLEFGKHRKTCIALCHALLHDDMHPVSTRSSAAASLIRRESSMDSAAVAPDSRSSFSGRSLTDVVTASGPRAYESRLAAIGDLKSCLEAIVDVFQTNLADTYKSYERDATEEMMTLLFTSKKFRRDAVQRMRNASVSSIRSADPSFFLIYEIRFRDYEKAKEELAELRRLLQCAESGISPSRPVEDIVIAPRGDVILEFANLAADPVPEEPVLRFRVSSHMLAGTSPIFARMFSGDATSLYLHDNDDISVQLPPAPTNRICKDESETRLYRMPQHETNHLGSMETLLHAAHMQHEAVPREVDFDQLVAIADCAMRYKSTSPLEIFVEHRWLPHWMSRGAQEMTDGLVAISYAFGERHLFTHASKSAILDLVDESDLRSRPWPQKIKDRIWAVRCAKMDQVLACCTAMIQEYIHAPPPQVADVELEPVSPGDIQDRSASESKKPKPPVVLTSATRCPKGNHGCDAANLGWMMLVFGEMGLLPHVMSPPVLSHMPATGPRSRSLAQTMDLLSRIPSPAFPIHRGGVCDPVPPFRAAIADVYNSVKGLTLYDISGKSHGWALSKGQIGEPQDADGARIGQVSCATKPVCAVTRELPDSVRLRILRGLDDVDDLQAAARTDRSFYQTYQRHEMELIRKFLRSDRLHGGQGRGSAGGGDPDDCKVLTSASNRIKSEGPIVKTDQDAMTLRGFGEGDESEAVTGSDCDTDDDAISSDGRDAAPPDAAEPPNYDESQGAGGLVIMASPLLHPSSYHQPLPLRALPPRTLPPAECDATACAAAGDGAPMTDEEMANIIWPPSVFPIAPPQRATGGPLAGVEGLREKFLAGDVSFADGLDEKMLVLMSQKKQRAGDGNG